jgi:hypothetical protein
MSDHASDKDLVDKLKEMDFTVDYVTELPSSANGYNSYCGLFINETVSSKAGMSFSTHDYPIPCICLEGWSVLADRWGGWVNDESSSPGTDWAMVTGQGEIGGESIIIKDSSHYITQDYDLDQEVAWSTATGEDLNNINPVSFKEVGVKYSAKLAQAKSYQEADFYTMIAVDSSYEGFPNRMFVWGLSRVGLEGKDSSQHLGTEDLFNIIEKAAEWAFLGKIIDTTTNPTDPNASTSTKISDIHFDIYPNPVTEFLNIRYFSSAQSNVLRISVIDLSGKEVSSVTETEAKPGYNFITHNCSELISGVYLIKLQTNDMVVTKKIVIN